MPLAGGFSPLHLLIVAVVALVVLGPEELPKLAKMAGRAYRDFARMRHHLSSELRDVVSDFDLGGTERTATPNAEDRAAIPPVGEGADRDGPSARPRTE